MIRRTTLALAGALLAALLAGPAPVLAGATPSPSASATAGPRPSPSATARAKPAPSPTRSPVSAPAAPRAVSGGGGFPAQYRPVPPTRVLDTRTGLGGYSHPFGADSTSEVILAGTPVVPASGVSAVVVNATVTRTTAQSLLILYPSGSGRPLASSLNFFAGQTVANLVTVNLGADGGIEVYQANGSADVILDVEGYYAPGGGGAGLYRPISPSRILDTRTGNGASGRLGPGATLDLTVAGRGGLPASGIAAVALNLTAVNGTAGSYLTAYPQGGSPPVASTVNFAPFRNTPNRVVVLLGGGRISIYNSLGFVDVVADVNGWYTDASDASASGGAYTGVLPSRVLDTRAGLGATHRLTAGSTVTPSVAGAGVPAGASAAVLNLTVTNPTDGSVATAYPANDHLPLASDLNFGPYDTLANETPVKLSPDAHFTVWNNLGTTDMVADLEGWFAAAPSPGSPPGTPAITSATASPTSATLSWTAPASALAITSYTVLIQPGGYQYPVAGNLTSATVPGLECGLGYQFQVAATSIAGSGPASAAAGLTLPACPTSNVIQDVPWIHQDYALSCEAASLEMAMFHENIVQSQSQILNDLGIDSRPAYWDSNGLRWGDAFANFVGDPNGAEYNYTGYGVYSDAIARVAGAYGARVLYAGQGVSPQTVYQALMAGHPVIAWITYTWTTPGRHDYLAFDGRWIPYAGPVEHSVTLIGVSPDSVLVNDPDRNQYWISRSTFEAVYGVYGDMAVILA